MILTFPLPALMVSAHGIGGREDLPVPFSFALVGGAVAVAVSFLALGVLWRGSRLRGDAAGRPLPGWLREAVDHPVTRAGLRVVGLTLVTFVAVALIFGRDDDLNPAARFVYVLFWVGLVPASLLFGPVWRALNPLRTLHLGLTALMRVPAGEGLWPLPRRIGYWPAAAGLLGFAWLELASPEPSSRTSLISWFGVYAALHLLAATAYGSTWFDRADGFETYSTLVSRLSPFGRRRDGVLVVRNPFDGLDGLTPAPGLVAVVSVLLGSTAFDSVAASPAWLSMTQSLAASTTLLSTLGLLATTGVVAATFTGAARLASALGGGQSAHREPAAMPGLFAHSILPIVVGYVLAHYFSMLVFEGQRALIQASDPLGTGADLIGTATRGVDYALVSALTIALVQVGAIVLGHIAGVVAAHDRAVHLFPHGAAVAGQLPLLVLMIGYTIGGILLLFPE
jgi:hypothetical protein